MKVLLRWLGFSLALGFFGLGLGLGLSLNPELTTGLFSENGKNIILHPARAQQDQATTPSQPVRPEIPAESARRTMTVDVARRVSPAVVSIGVSKTTYVRQYDPFFGGDLFFSPYLVAPLRQNFPYLGSGFIIDREGHVITNYHVVEDASSITVTLTDRRTYKARLLEADRYVDVALLKIEGLGEAEDLPVMRLGDSDDIMIGETVLAVGNPFGPLIADPRPSVSRGVVSAVDRSFRNNRDERIYRDMIQTDAAINPGNSGGPLVNLDGEAIGINTFIFSRSGDSASVGFSIPINRAKRIVEEILQYGKVRAIRMDFDVLSLSPYIVQALQLDVRQGALVKATEIGGPAEMAGLEPGDVIVEADGNKIDDAKDLISHMLSRTVGETIRLRVIRGDKELMINYPIMEASR